MKSLLAVTLLMICSVIAASAAVPEIDPASAGSAIALLAGALFFYRGSRR